MFIDVSTSATGDDAVFRRYAASILRALSEDFVSTDDRVVIYIFCDNTYSVASTHPDVHATTGDYAGVLRRLSDPADYGSVLAAAPANKLIFTDFTKLTAELLSRLDQNRPQFFIIASDFLHDPRNRDCSMDLIRDPEISGMESELGRLSAVATRHLFLLWRPIDWASHCNKPLEQIPPSVQGIPTRMQDILAKAFIAREVRAQGAPSDDAAAIRKSFCELPRAFIVDDAERTPDHVKVRVENTNPFVVNLKRIEITDRSGAEIGALVPDPKVAKIDCGTRDFTVATPKPPRDNTTTLTARVEYDLGSPKPGPPIPFARVEIGAKRLIFIPDWRGGSVVLDVTLKPMLRAGTAITVKVGSGLDSRTIPIAAGSGREQRLLVPISLSGNDADTFKDLAAVPVTLSVTDGTELLAGAENVNGKAVDADLVLPLVARVGKPLEPLSAIITVVTAVILLWLAGRRIWATIVVLVGVALVLLTFLKRADWYEPLRWPIVVDGVYSIMLAVTSGVLMWAIIVTLVWPRWESRLLPNQVAVARRSLALTTIVASTLLGGVIGFYFSPFPIFARFI